MTTFPINFAKAVIWDLKGINLIQLAHRRQVCHHCCAQKNYHISKYQNAIIVSLHKRDLHLLRLLLPRYAAILIYCFNAFFSSPFVFVRGIKDPHYKTGTIQRYFPPSPTYLPTYLLDHEYVGHYLPLFGLFQLFYSIKKFHSNVAICTEFFYDDTE